MATKKTAGKRKLVKVEPRFEYRIEESESTALETIYAELFKLVQQNLTIDKFRK